MMLLMTIFLFKKFSFTYGCTGSSWHHMSALAGRSGLSSFSMWAQLSHSMWDPSSPTKDQTHVPFIGRQVNPWTTREVLNFSIACILLYTSSSLLADILTYLLPGSNPVPHMLTSSF